MRSSSSPANIPHVYPHLIFLHKMQPNLLNLFPSHYSLFDLQSTWNPAQKLQGFPSNCTFSLLPIWTFALTARCVVGISTSTARVLDLLCLQILQRPGTKSSDNVGRMVSQDNLKVDSTSTKEATSVDTVTHDQTPAETSTSPHLPTSEPDLKNTLSDKIPTAQPLLPTLSFNTSTKSSAHTTQVTTSSVVSQVPSKSGPKQPVTTSPDSVLNKTQSTVPKPKIIILHHDTVIDGRRVIVRTIQNCFAAILGTNAPQPSEAAILNAFAHKATLVDALVQLGAFKNLNKLVPSSAAGGTGAAAAVSKNETTKNESKANNSKTTKGKDKEATAVPTTPPTQEEKQYEYQHAVALWTQAYLHYTHEFLRKFETYPDLESLNKQMKEQGIAVVILVAQDGFEPSTPEEASNIKDGEDKDGKKKQQQQPAKGVKIIQEQMRRMGVTAAGKGSRGYQGVGRQASAGATVVVDGIYACDINGKEVVRAWKEEILPGFITARLAQKAKTNGKGETKTNDEKNAKKDTEMTTGPTMQKQDVVFACSSKQYLSLARAIGATACWVARCEDKGKMTEQQADIVVEDLEKLSRLIVSEISESKHGKGEEASHVVDAMSSHCNKEKTEISATSNMKGQAQTRRQGNAATVQKDEDVEMTDAPDHYAEASVEQEAGGEQMESEHKSEPKLSFTKVAKTIKTETDEFTEDDATVATIVASSSKSPGAGKKRAREDDDLEEWLPVEKVSEEVPFVDLTEEA